MPDKNTVPEQEPAPHLAWSTISSEYESTTSSFGIMREAAEVPLINTIKVDLKGSTSLLHVEQGEKTRIHTKFSVTSATEKDASLLILRQEKLQCTAQVKQEEHALTLTLMTQENFRKDSGPRWEAETLLTVGPEVAELHIVNYGGGIALRRIYGITCITKSTGGVLLMEDIENCTNIVHAQSTNLRIERVSGSTELAVEGDVDKNYFFSIIEACGDLAILATNMHGAIEQFRGIIHVELNKGTLQFIGQIEDDSEMKASDITVIPTISDKKTLTVSGDNKVRIGLNVSAPLHIISQGSSLQSDSQRTNKTNSRPRSIEAAIFSHTAMPDQGTLKVSCKGTIEFIPLV